MENNKVESKAITLNLCSYLEKIRDYYNNEKDEFILSLEDLIKSELVTNFYINTNYENFHSIGKILLDNGFAIYFSMSKDEIDPNGKIEIYQYRWDKNIETKISKEDIQEFINNSKNYGCYLRMYKI